MKPLIYAKSAFNVKNALAKHNIGCDGIEIQLLDENLDMRFGIEEMYPIEDFERMVVKSIHAPLCYKYNNRDCCILLENLYNYKVFRDLHRIFQIANYFGKLHNEKIPIVIHSECDVESLKGVWDKICENLMYVLSLYSYTKLLIENVTPIEEDKSDIGFHLTNNYGFGIVNIVHKLRRDLQTDRIGAVLDLCHAGITEYQIDKLTHRTSLYNIYNIRNYFKEFKDVCELIHFNWFKDDGMCSGHGTVPDVFKCKELLGLYNEFEYTCPLVLEVYEYDYLNCNHYKQLKEMIDSYYNGEL